MLTWHGYIGVQIRTHIAKEMADDLKNVSELIRDAAKSISRLDDLSKEPPQLSAATRGALIRVLKHDLAQHPQGGHKESERASQSRRD
jgi:hypothetical protein